MNWSHLLFSFDGRITRQTFWIAFTAVVGLEFVCQLIVYPLESGERLSAIVSLAFAYPEFAVCAKRGHDRNISPRVVGAFFLLSVSLDFITVLGLGGTRDELSPILVALSVPWAMFAVALLIELGVRRGTPGPNRYGPDPLA